MREVIMRGLNSKGFTLIELMVVIVIIGVLASLAVPRFTQVANRAKVSEVPRMLASYETAYIAALTELDFDNITLENIIFAAPESKWFDYTITGDNAETGTAEALSQIGVFPEGGTLITTYNPTTEKFGRSAGGGVNTDVLNKLLPTWQH
jgi:prepilin-type N-terminal cleavage/methylation domain-containing protein